MADKEEEARPLVGIGPGTPWDYNPYMPARAAKAAESARHWQQARIKEETRPLVGVEPLAPVYYKSFRKEARRARRAAEKARELKEAERVLPRGGSRTEADKALPMAMKTHCNPVGDAALSEKELLHLLEYEPAPVSPVPADAKRAAPRRACNWLRRLFSPRPLSAEELDAQHDKEVRRCSVSRSELRAINHKIVLQCLDWYNSTHPGKEYEPAPGVVTRCSTFNKSLLWTHGNFLARPKRSGCCSFLPAPRTLFFFELLDRYYIEEVITCTPLDEPVTEAYSFLGLPLGWGTRRDGRCDCVCKTCYRQFHVPHIDLKRTCACGDSKVEGVCRMCYLYSDVLHPSGGGFAYGHTKQSFAY